MSSDCCGPNTSTRQALQDIVLNNGVNDQGLDAVYTELETIVDPAVNQVATALIETLITQLVFFVVIVVIFLIVVVIVICREVISMPALEILAVVVAIIIVAIVLVVIIAFYALNVGRTAIDAIADDVTSGVTSDDLFNVINNAAFVYLQAL